MAVRAHRSLRSRSGRWLLYPVFAMVALASIGGGYQTLGEAADATAYPMPGQLIDVGGHRLHLYCAGSGSPTVVLEPGAGEMSSNFGWIAPAIARSTRTCVYDRAGRGWSEAAQPARTGIQMAADLHTLLQRGHVPGPYVLAGHSFGGLYVQAFAARYPTEVAGLVLIDSTGPRTTAQGHIDRPSFVDRAFALVSASARLGLGRLYALIAANTLPPRSAREVNANIATAGNLRSTIDEYAGTGDWVKQAASLTDFGTKPLVVLTAGLETAPEHRADQNRMAELSTNSAHRTVEGASHEGLVAEQDHAATTTRAILDVIAAVRIRGPLVK
jgi:pimeloyl-ACP methyl ester carboxylesterase